MFSLFVLFTTALAFQKRARLDAERVSLLPTSRLNMLNESKQRRRGDTWEEYYENSLALEDRIINTLWYIQDVHCERMLVKKEIRTYTKELEELDQEDPANAAMVERLNERIDDRQVENKKLKKQYTKKVEKYENVLGQDASTIDLSTAFCKELYEVWALISSGRRRMIRASTL